MPQAQRQRLQDQRSKIDRAAAMFVRLLEAAVIEERHGDTTMSVSTKGGVITFAKPATEYTELLT